MDVKKFIRDLVSLFVLAIAFIGADSLSGFSGGLLLFIVFLITVYVQSNVMSHLLFEKTTMFQLLSISLAISLAISFLVGFNVALSFMVISWGFGVMTFLVIGFNKAFFKAMD